MEDARLGLVLLLVFQFAAFPPCTALKRSSKYLEGQLYEDLLYDYNKIPRPVRNSSDIMTVDVGASLIRVIDVDEKNQVLTTNIWLEMKWVDAKLTWDPARYGGVRRLHIPADLIWTPDLVLYNNAAGDPDITILTDAQVTYDGQVSWQPPAIYKSFCPIDVTWFPYDSQHCEMKFGTWTYTGRYVDLKQLPKESVELRRDAEDNDIEFLEMGMDLSFYYQSAEWDLLSLTSARHSVLYASCCGPEKYVDVTYYFQLRRKHLFFSCNLIGPCFLISMLTTIVFYLPDHKITFSVSILVTLTVFFLVLIDIMPPTSLVIPMFGRYLITTMILVALSTVISVVTVNFRFRSGSAHRMSPWIRTVFLHLLPKILMMHRPGEEGKETSEAGGGDDERFASALADKPTVFNATVLNGDGRPRMAATKLYGDQKKKRKTHKEGGGNHDVTTDRLLNNTLDMGAAATLNNFIKTAPAVAFSRSKKRREPSPTPTDDYVFLNVLQQVRFIAQHFRHSEREAEVSDDWVWVAHVLDRLFLIIFFILNIGTFLIILEAPSIYDSRSPLNNTVPTKPLGQANLFS